MRRAACILSGLEFGFCGGLGAHATVLVGLAPLAAAVRDGRGGGLLAAADAGGHAGAVVVVVVMVVAVVVVVGRAPIRARTPVLTPQVRVAALLRSAPVGLSVLEAPREVDHEAGGSGAAGSAIRFPFGSVFPESSCRREDGVFLEAARSGPHVSNSNGPRGYPKSNGRNDGTVETVARVLKMKMA